MSYIKNDNIEMQRMSVCLGIWDKLSIDWDGSVSACNSNHDNMMLVGNILKNDLMEIFHGEREKSYRDILKDNRYERLYAI